MRGRVFLAGECIGVVGVVCVASDCCMDAKERKIAIVYGRMKGAWLWRRWEIGGK